MKIGVIPLLGLITLTLVSGHIDPCNQVVIPTLINGSLDYDAYSNCLTNVIQVVFLRQTMRKLPEKLFEEMPALNNVIVKHCHIPSLNNSFFGLESTAKLTSLSLPFNKIETIADNTFSKTTSLTFLNLADNKIEELFDQSFGGLDKLKVLNITGNELATICDFVFKDLVNLEAIDLSRNKLVRFSMHILRFNTKLLKVSLQHNFIQSVTLPTFNGNIIYLDLQFNRLTTVPKDLYKLTSLSQLLLSYNNLQLTTTSFSTMPASLSQLFLSNVGLAKVAKPLSLFVGLQNLKSLSITRNELKNFDVSELPKLPELMILMLYANDFTYINFSDIRSKLPRLQQIGLSQTTWTCGNLKKMLEQLEQLGIERFFYKSEFRVFGIDNNIENIGCKNDEVDIISNLLTLVRRLEVKVDTLTKQLAGVDKNMVDVKETVRDLETKKILLLKRELDLHKIECNHQVQDVKHTLRVVDGTLKTVSTRLEFFMNNTTKTIENLKVAIQQSGNTADQFIRLERIVQDMSGMISNIDSNYPSSCPKVKDCINNAD